MRTLFSGEVFVHYGQLSVESTPEGCGGGLAEPFAGQEGGLCGAAVPGGLFLTTGLHTGDVGFTVELHESEPSLDDSWEEIVEVPFRPLSSQVELLQWAGEDSWDLDLEEIDYRVRYCATGMEEAQRTEHILAEEPPVVDRYLLQFWPSPPRPARVVKQTTATAAHSHEWARKLPPPRHRRSGRRRSGPPGGRPSGSAWRRKRRRGAVGCPARLCVRSAITSRA